MAIDKAVDSARLDAGLTSVADAIRAKGGSSASLAFPAGFVSAIQAISAGSGGGANYIVHGTYTAASAQYIAYHMFTGTSPWLPAPSYNSGVILCRTDFELKTDATGPQNVHLAVFIYSPTKMYIGTIGQRSNQTSQQAYGQVISRASPDSFSDVANFGSMWTGYYSAGQKVTITETEIPDEIADYLFTFTEVTA